MPTDTTVSSVWSEPELAPAEVILDLTQPGASVPKLLLKANVPSTVKLVGPADLLFASLTVTLTAQLLERNLALPEWGSTRSVVEVPPPHQDGSPTKALEFLLPGLSRVEATGIRAGAAAANVRIDIKDAGAYRPITSTLSLTQSSDPKGWFGLALQAFQTDAVRIHLTGDDVNVLLRSPSLPARVGVAVGNDTPVQVFPAQMDLAGTVTTRNLAPYLNAAWQEGKGKGNVEIALRLTSLTDGVVSLNLAGAWSRAYNLGPQTVQLDPFNVVTLNVDWPSETLTSGLASLQVEGEIGTGMRQGLVDGTAQFGVRMRGNLELAQPFLLADGSTITDSMTLLGVWLMLPEVPTADEKLTLYIAEADEDSLAPSADRLVEVEAALPASASAYIKTEGKGYWVRVPFAKPFELSGAKVTRPLCLVASGKAQTLLLSQQFSPMAPSEAEVQKLTVGRAGNTLVRNLDWAEPWRPLTFSQKTAVWQADLELQAPAQAYRRLIYAQFPGEPIQALTLDGPGQKKCELPWLRVSRPEQGPLAIKLFGRTSAKLGARVSLMQSVGSQ